MSPADRRRLEALVGDRNVAQKHVWRARIVLHSADGIGTNGIMRRTGKSKTCVWRWQERFAQEGYDGLLRDKTRPSRIPPLGPEVVERVVALTLSDPPAEATHWVAAIMAKATGISVSSVQRIWRAHGLRPHRWNSEGSFHKDELPDLRADYILANPPFNISDWGGERLLEDPRWKYGIPPAGNANFGWLQHILHHLGPNGTAGVVRANGSMSSGQSGEGDIRKAMIEGGVVDCMIALPGQLFYSTQIPACLWFLAKNRKNGRFRDRSSEILFIDARKLGVMVDRTRREFEDADVAKIADAYHRWREGRDYEDVPGFCKSAALDAIKGHGHVLTPGRYVGAEAQEDDGEPFGDKMKRLVAQLREQQAEATKLDAAIAANLKELGYGG